MIQASFVNTSPWQFQTIVSGKLFFPVYCSFRKIADNRLISFSTKMWTPKEEETTRKLRYLCWEKYFIQECKTNFYVYIKFIIEDYNWKHKRILILN
jgi:hypothetical protein